MGNVIGIQFSCDAIFSRCLNCTLGKAAYVSKLEDNLAALQKELQKLIEARNGAMRRVMVAEQRQMKRTDQEQGWLSRVETVETDAGELTSDNARKTLKLCFGGYCSKNCKSSYSFGKQVAKTQRDVATLMGALVSVADVKPAEPIVVGLQSKLEQVWGCIVEEPAGIIGIYGMGGVVSKDLRVENIQENIAKMFDDLWKIRSLEEKATLLRASIKPQTSSEQLVNITLDVLFFYLGRGVTCISKNDAWELFRYKVGEETLNNHPDILELAQTVVKQSDGLPLALITISQAMACRKTAEEWRYAIQALTSSASRFPGLGEGIYPLLKFSYDSLPNDTIRSCLF